METPSSTKRVTRSHTFATSNDASVTVSRKIEDSEKNLSKSKPRGQQQDQSALIDITNDSPIVGLANGVILDTPLAKQRGSRVRNAPGSGEALLRGQVKTLLLKVEEEVELSKFSLEAMGLLATMPENTPQIQNLSGFGSVTPSVVLQQPLIPRVVSHVFDGKNQGSSESEKSLINRSLLLDFSDKSQLSNASEECFSELSYEEVVQGEGIIEQPTEDDDDASIWSMQVNASTHDEDEQEDYSEDVQEGGGGTLLDELCEGLNNISMKEKIAPKFAGKHTRFVYNSDDEIVKEEVEENFAQSASSPDILRLKGLPTPKGKHLRFCEEDEGKSAL
ncbi:hypothetical protein E2542_SST06637 [Spatholobus suberectus]|nr:hypothetical protein E2542_SST06637 [Spatholobus suberectus]